MIGKPLDIKGIGTTVLGALLTGRALTPETSHTIAAISGALIGVLSTYIGGKVSDSSPPPPKE